MNALVPVNTAPPMTVSDVERVALAIAKGGLFGSKDPNAVLTLCLLAQAEGQHPAVVFRDYHIISGKPAKKAEAMLRDFIQAGGKVEWHQLDDTCADATFTHPSGSARIAWDHKRVQAAQLGNNAMYRKYPRQMLRSRVISEGIRTVYPGATSGLYEEGEVASFNEPRPVIEAPANETVGEFEDTNTGQVIDPDALREPAAREKLDGPHTSKTALREAVNAIIVLVRNARTMEELDEIKAENKRTINQALRDWPLLINGDPRIEEDGGLKGAIEEKREELSGSLTFQLLVSTLQECTSEQDLNLWKRDHLSTADSLTDGERAEFDEILEVTEASLKQLAVVTHGA